MYFSNIPKIHRDFIDCTLEKIELMLMFQYFFWGTKFPSSRSLAQSTWGVLRTRFIEAESPSISVSLVPTEK